MRALKHTEGRLDKIARAELREIGTAVRSRAQAHIEHSTGRHGSTSLPPLASTLKISAAVGGLSVYSAQPYAGIQERGGRVGKGAIIPRARASAYMTKGVQDARGEVEEAVIQIGRKIEDAYGGM